MLQCVHIKTIQTQTVYAIDKHNLLSACLMKHCQECIYKLPSKTNEAVFVGRKEARNINLYIHVYIANQTMLGAESNLSKWVEANYGS